MKRVITPYIPSTDKIRSFGQRLKELSYQISLQKDVEMKFDDIFKMARVEGYDDSSYIISSIKDIKRKISNKQLERIPTKINQILDDVMPFDYYQFFKLYKATEQTAERLKGKACWVLLGPTGIQFNLLKI